MSVEHTHTGEWHRADRVAVCAACARAVLARDLRAGDVVRVWGHPIVYRITGNARRSALHPDLLVIVRGRRDDEPEEDLLFAASAELDRVEVAQ